MQISSVIKISWFVQGQSQQKNNPYDKKIIMIIIIITIINLYFP